MWALITLRAICRNEMNMRLLNVRRVSISSTAVIIILFYLSN